MIIPPQGPPAMYVRGGLAQTARSTLLLLLLLLLNTTCSAYSIIWSELNPGTHLHYYQESEDNTWPVLTIQAKACIPDRGWDA